MKAALAVITLPYSDTYFLSAYPRECTETFQAGHVAGFEFFGGVPLRISYDNTTIAVTKVMGRERMLTRAFLALESHHLFAHHFCRVGRGNEKGHVENHVGYSRRNLLVPVPSFASLAALNEYLAACCYADLFRRVRGKVGTKAERLVEDRAAMLALPDRDLRAPAGGPGTRQLALARALRPQRLLGADGLCPPRGDRHRRHRGGGHHQRDRRGGPAPPVLGQGAHHLRPPPLPGPLGAQARGHRLRPAARGLGAARLLRHPAPAPGGRPRTRGHPGVHQGAAPLGERQHWPALARAVEQALAIGATGSDAIALILFHHAERPVGLFSLDGHPHLKSVVIDPPDLSAYRTLDSARGAALMKQTETKSLVLLRHHLKPCGCRPSGPSARRWPPRPRPTTPTTSPTCCSSASWSCWTGRSGPPSVG